MQANVITNNKDNKTKTVSTNFFFVEIASEVKIIMFTVLYLSLTTP
jgi:hypothetical protein